jgi:hypothetical protein
MRLQLLAIGLAVLVVAGAVSESPSTQPVASTAALLSDWIYLGGHGLDPVAELEADIQEIRAEINAGNCSRASMLEQLNQQLESVSGNSARRLKGFADTSLKAINYARRRAGPSAARPQPA